MAKKETLKKKPSLDTLESKVVESPKVAEAPKKVAESPKVAEAPKPAPPKEGPPCTFTRWFRSKNFKPHWQGGMEACRDTSGKKTPEEWDRIFKDY